MKKNYSLFFFLFLLFTKNIYSQNAGGTKYDPYTNPVILAHYPVDYLQQIEVSDTLRFKTIVYYYTQSFIIEKVDCFDCIELDISKVDVSNYENYRKPHERLIREIDKYGVKITLLSTDELLYKMPIHIQ